MRKLHAALVAAGGLALAAGTAYAAGKLNTMNVALPDGSVAQIQYEGNVAPRVAILPQAASDPFAEMDRMQAEMQARHQAIMAQVAEMQARTQAQVQQQLAAAQQGSAGVPGRIVVSTDAPAGSYSFVSVSTTTSGNGCTQTIETRSDGTGAEPKVTRTSAGDCSAVQKDAAPAPAPKAPAVSPTQARMPGRTT
ncbi:MAG: hypothetical protein QM676_12635 [Novosphingobium sp.]